MVFGFFTLYAIGLVTSLIGIIKRVKGAYLMFLMWVITIGSYILAISDLQIWWVTFLVAKLALIFQILWIGLANNTMREEK